MKSYLSVFAILTLVSATVSAEESSYKEIPKVTEQTYSDIYDGFYSSCVEGTETNGTAEQVTVFCTCGATAYTNNQRGVVKKYDIIFERDLANKMSEGAVTPDQLAVCGEKVRALDKKSKGKTKSKK